MTLFSDPYKLIFEKVATGIVLIDPDNGQLLDYNQTALHMLGYSADDFSKLNLHDIEKQEASVDTLVLLEKIQHYSMPFEYTSYFQHANGSVRRFVVTYNHFIEAERPYLLANWQDVTEAYQQHEFEVYRNQVLELMANSAPIDDILRSIVLGMETLNPETHCSLLLLDENRRYFNRGIAPHLPEALMTALKSTPIEHMRSGCSVVAHLGSAVYTDNILTHEYYASLKEVTEKSGLKSCWSQPILSPKNTVIGTFAIYYSRVHKPSDTELHHICQTARLASIALEKDRAEELIRNLAYYDSLTQLPNRRLLTDRLEQAMNTTKRSSLHGAIMMIDLDNFKPLNDEHGHATGDLLLIEAAKRLTDTIRESDTAVRLGGDEFVVLINDLDHELETSYFQAMAVAEKLLHILEKPYSLKTTKDQASSIIHQCTASIGVTLFKGHSLSQNQIIKAADQAMYSAKKAGRNQIFLDRSLEEHKPIQRLKKHHK